MKTMYFKTEEEYRKWEHKFHMNRYIDSYFGGFDCKKGWFLQWIPKNK